MTEYFKVDKIENVGENWLIADFGVDNDGEQYILTTESIHLSELHEFSQGAKADCELVARLLNAYVNGKIKLPEVTP